MGKLLLIPIASSQKNHKTWCYCIHKLFKANWIQLYYQKQYYKYILLKNVILFNNKSNLSTKNLAHIYKSWLKTGVGEHIFHRSTSWSWEKGRGKETWLKKFKKGYIQGVSACTIKHPPKCQSYFILYHLHNSNLQSWRACYTSYPFSSFHCI